MTIASYTSWWFDVYDSSTIGDVDDASDGINEKKNDFHKDETYHFSEFW